MKEATNEIKTIGNLQYFEEVRRLLISGKEIQIPVRGHSMEPFIKEGDCVQLEAFQKRHLKLGMILLALHEGRYVLHRLVKIKNNVLVLAGDGNISQLEYVSQEDTFAAVRIKSFDGKKKDMQGKIPRFLGLSWYYSRGIRLFIIRLKKIWNLL